MILSNVFNPKSLTRSADRKSNINPALSKSMGSGKKGATPTARASEFFSYRGIGEALSPITSEQLGRIHFCGTDWPAQLILNRTEDRSVCILTGMMVQVVGRQGITLLVSMV